MMTMMGKIQFVIVLRHPKRNQSGLKTTPNLADNLLKVKHSNHQITQSSEEMIGVFWPDNNAKSVGSVGSVGCRACNLF